MIADDRRCRRRWRRRSDRAASGRTANRLRSVVAHRRRRRRSWRSAVPSAPPSRPDRRCPCRRVVRRVARRPSMRRVVVVAATRRAEQQHADATSGTSTTSIGHCIPLLATVPASSGLAPGVDHGFTRCVTVSRMKKRTRKLHGERRRTGPTSVISLPGSAVLVARRRSSSLSCSSLWPRSCAFLPGDAAPRSSASGRRPQLVERVREQMGLDESVPEQVGEFVGNAVQRRPRRGLLHPPAGARHRDRGAAAHDRAGHRRRCWWRHCSRYRSACWPPLVPARCSTGSSPLTSIVAISIPSLVAGLMLLVVFGVQFEAVPDHRHRRVPRSDRLPASPRSCRRVGAGAGRGSGTSPACCGPAWSTSSAPRTSAPRPRTACATA